MEKIIKKGQIVTEGELYSIIRIPRWTYHDGGKRSRVNRIWKNCTACNGYIGFQTVIATVKTKEEAMKILKYYNRYSGEYWYMYSKNPKVIIHE